MPKTMIQKAALAAALILGVPAYAQAQDSGTAAGRVFITQNCLACHDIEPRQGGAHPSKSGPNFQAIADARTTTGMGLNVFLTTPHANMPNFVIAAQDRSDVITFILSLRGKNKAKPQ